jgi:hypothetical protein
MATAKRKTPVLRSRRAGSVYFQATSHAGSGGQTIEQEIIGKYYK